MTVKVCGICGGSGSGKTTLTDHLLDSLGTDQVSVVSFDSYYRDLSNISMAERSVRNYDHPDSLDSELFVSHLDRLRSGHGIDVPIYDFASHTRSERTERVEAHHLVVIEGILLACFPEIAERVDILVFIDVSEEIRLERRLKRDVAERGRLPGDVRRQFAETVAPMHDLYVEPHKGVADRVVRIEETYIEVATELSQAMLHGAPG